MTEFGHHSSFCRKILPSSILAFCLLFIWATNSQICLRWSYDPKNFDCCRNYELCEKENRACCGKHCYSKSASLCCQGRIIDKCSLFHAVCCGKVCVDRMQSLCCNGRVMPACAQYFSGCCNGKCYDIRTQMCCQGQVVTKCADDRHASCCAYECFNNQTSTCCNSYYVIQSKCPGDRCCGSVCCDGAERS